MFTLIGIGVAAAFGYSVVATLAPDLFPASFHEHGRAAVYFEAAAVIVSLTLLGQLLELRARSRTAGAIKGLLSLAPKEARRLRDDGTDARKRRGFRVGHRPGRARQRWPQRMSASPWAPAPTLRCRARESRWSRSTCAASCARMISEATVANMKQNLGFAFLYNALGVPLAAGVFFPVTGWLLSPMITALAMSLSSVSVVTNALRLAKTAASA